MEAATAYALIGVSSAIGVAMGAAAAGLLVRAGAVRLRMERDAAADSAARLSQDLQSARDEGETWRRRFQDEEVAKTREATAASRIPSLEAELRDAQAKIEAATGERAGFQEKADRLPIVEAEVAGLRSQILDLASAKSELETKLVEHAKSHDETVTALTAVRGEIEKDLKNIAADTLRQNQESFLNLANEAFAKHKEGATADLDARGKAIEQLLAPVRDTLAVYQTNLVEIEKARMQSQGALSAELKNVIDTQVAVRSETSKLVNALRGAPKTRGRWGENTLKNVLELAGLSPYCDFTTEESFQRDGATFRPDVVIRLSGGRSLVVDAKTSLNAYLDAVEAIEDEVREKHLLLHASQIRNHVKQLASKAYWDGLAETPDYVVMFVPGENFYAAAAEKDPTLFEDALAQRVLIATPATLIAIAKAVAFGWRQEKVAENAKRVHDLGRDLYARLSKMSEHVIGLGRSIEGTVKRYNDFVGSLETRVMPQARRFTELEVEGTATPIEVATTVELMPKQLQPNRDMLMALPPADAETVSTPSAAE
jgi:DNA recombination protein RmuC